MADSRLTLAIDTIARLLRDDTSAIELYRADFATPQTLEAMRFWAQTELNRIQSGFSSTDDVVRLLAKALSEVIASIEEGGSTEPGAPGAPGDPGEPGQPGPPGPPGDCECEDVIDDLRILFDKTWSSEKINREMVSHANNANAHHPQLHVLNSHTDVNAVPAHRDSLTWVNGFYVADHRIKGFIQETTPPDLESSPGDIWVVVPDLN
jgi:hypothetical protein